MNYLSIVVVEEARGLRLAFVFLKRRDTGNRINNSVHNFLHRETRRHISLFVVRAKVCWLI